MLTLEQTQKTAEKLRSMGTYGHFINGEWVNGHSGKTIDLYDPTTRKVLGSIQAGDPSDVARAVDAAHAAFPAWSASSALERQRLLLALGEVMRKRQLDYAVMDVLNNGKPIREAMGHTGHAADIFDYYAGAAHQLKGEVLDQKDATVIVHREAIGVVAQIIPWNSQMTMAALKLAPALAAGCTVVLKPAETVCLAVLEFIKDAAGIIPPGVINVVTGYGADVGEALVTNPKVRKVSFTGSRDTGAKIIQYASVNIIPQTMELGGKSANIICEDADLEAAAESVVLSTVANKGEICFAGTRTFVHKNIREAFLDTLARQLANVRQGDPLDPATQIGPQSSSIQFDRVKAYIELGRKEGAKVAIGGEAAKVPGFEDGLFIQPTIFTDVDHDMRIAQEEIFGPVTTILEWEDEAELLARVNDNIFGLGGGVWTQNLARAHRISRGMETGIVWINRYYNIRSGQPLGGYKQSGFGRDNCLDTVLDYTLQKSVVINLAEGPLGLFGAAAAPGAGAHH
ncbi:aldehyde dehydrogenase family protein [Novosphingobium terrae]|uniref:aldehyde dehydrogenase family protein n=1 Tax=Novosphingobium terrae TaxID=2726189 RepID=UPI001F139B2B|nr:aldehyde dehydrogenase family protein [Novosphingobium terrae]